MSELDDLRQEIDNADKEIVALFKKRMAAVLKVANVKGRGSGKVYNPQREEEVLEKVSSYAGELSENVEALYRTLMRQSREYQYTILSKTDKSNEFLNTVKNAFGKTKEVKKVAYGGLLGSYSHIAAKNMYKSAKHINLTTFDDVFSAVKDGSADVGVVPLDNTTGGTVNEVYDYLLKYHFYILKSAQLPIKNCLLAKQKIKKEDIKEIHSHPQALAQCADFIKENRFTPVPHVNTAIAAHYVKEQKRADIAAIASEEAAEQLGLQIIDNNINMAEHNVTRFISIASDMYIEEDADKISLAFSLPHKSGALADTLSLFADYKLNLNKIQSRPMPDKPWEYFFYLDFLGSIKDDKVIAALYQMCNELPDIHFLGNYIETNVKV